MIELIVRFGAMVDKVLSPEICIIVIFGFILVGTVIDTFTNKGGGSTGDWWG